jgi:hypothetical protein
MVEVTSRKNTTWTNSETSASYMIGAAVAADGSRTAS